MIHPPELAANVSWQGDPTILEQQARRWLRAFFAVLLGCALLLVPNLLFLFHTNEDMDVRDIAKLQRQHRSGLYLSAVKEYEPQYKLALYKDAKPDVVVIGSSRVMHMRSEAFSTSFVNLGGTMRSVRQGRSFIRSMLAVHKPKLLLIGVDFFWFNPNYPEPDFEDADTAPDSRLTLQTMLRPFKWLRDGRVPPRTFVDLVEHGQMHDFGVQAVVRGEGFAYDGATRPVWQLLGQQTGEGEDRQFHETLERVEKGGPSLEYGSTIDEGRWQSFVALLEETRAAGVPVLTYLPPVARPVYDTMRQSGKYGYMSEVRERMARLETDAHDFSDARTLGSEPCEFIDGRHGGDITDLRILLAMTAGSDQGAAILTPLMDRARAESIIRRYVGHASFVGPGESFEEVDFLGLGCPKK